MSFSRVRSSGLIFARTGGIFPGSGQDFSFDDGADAGAHERMELSAVCYGGEPGAQLCLHVFAGFSHYGLVFSDDSQIRQRPE